MGNLRGFPSPFDGSDQSSVPGLGLIRSHDHDKSVPHIVWTSARAASRGNAESRTLYGLHSDSTYYYVHSYVVPYKRGVLEQEGSTVATAKYGEEEFISAIGQGNTFATQFRLDKSG
jgi:glutamine amidotransferase/cyclase